ncbi:hypothetical protein CISIN_1g036302mg, partial [Citrus sinensis]
MMIKPSDQKKEKQIYEFCCEECSFEIGYGSAAMLMQCQEGNQEHIKHICHEHPLTLIMMKEDYGPCKLCDVIIRGPTYGYGCTPCEFYAHKSCFELPHQVRHHFHPSHFLVLETKRFDSENIPYCQACGSLCRGFRYQCSAYCAFSLHIECATLAPNIKYIGHTQHLVIRIDHVDMDISSQGRGWACNACGFDIDHQVAAPFLRCVECDLNFHEECDTELIKHFSHPHPLVLCDNEEEETNDDKVCYACNKLIQAGPAAYICSCNFTSPNAYYLRCVKCDFNIHLWCIPLPETIKHESHHHSLILADKLANDDYEDEVCDICEEQRDRRECAYYCAECDFVAEFSCVRSLVLVCLKENCRDVPLRVVSKEAGLTIEDLFESLTEEEIKKIDDICMDIDKEMEQVSGTLSLSSSVINTSDFSEKAPNYYSDETLLQLMVTLHRSYNSVSSLGWDYDGVDEQKVVNVGGYKISKKLAPILEKLLSKYGDLADYALSLSSGLKNDFVIRLCEVVQS